jgi:two-component system OmpR family sensor kinase
LATDSTPDRHWALQSRLRRQLLAWIGGLWLVGTCAATAGLWYETTEILDSSLEETAQLLLASPDASILPLKKSLSDLDPHEEYVIYQIYDAQGAMTLRSHDAPATPMDPDPSNGVRQAGSWHVLTLNARDGHRRVQVAETREHRREVLWASASWQLGMLVVVLTLAALGIRTLLTRAFATLDPSRQELSSRPAHDLRPLDTRGLPDELQPWLETVNGLMARMRATVDAERAFAAHTAHELRTPLAAARAQAQRLAEAATGAAERDNAQALVRQLDRLTHLATRLLQLARIESGVALKREPVDLVELARLLADDFDEARRTGRLHLESSAESVVVHGDIDALGIALRNLIDNALKHGGSHAQVVLRIDSSGLSVVDDGPGVPAGGLSYLGRKFERGNRLTDGTGLGLAMVGTIAMQSDATLQLQSPVSNGRGFSATIRFRQQAAC